MRSRSLSGTVAGALLVLLGAMGSPSAQPALDAGLAARVDAAMRAAFAALYALPSDTDAVAMGEWVRDTDRSVGDSETGTWTLRITRLEDTGQALKLNEEMWRLGGATTARQIAESASAMQRIEGRISKAEAEAALDVTVTINPPEVTLAGVSEGAERARVAIDGAQLAMRVRGDWTRVDDPELDIDSERWSPAALLIGFGGPWGPLEAKRAPSGDRPAILTAPARPASGARGIHSVGISVQGSDAMLDRLLRETNWAALAALIN